MTADHSGANKHWMNQRNLMRASIRNHRVYLYIRDIIDISKLNTCQKEELHCKSTRRTSKHLTSAIGRKSLSFFPLGHSRSRSRYWTVGLGSKLVKVSFVNGINQTNHSVHFSSLGHVHPHGCASHTSSVQQRGSTHVVAGR